MEDNKKELLKINIQSCINNHSYFTESDLREIHLDKSKAISLLNEAAKDLPFKVKVYLDLDGNAYVK